MDKRAADKARFIRVCHEKIDRAKKYPGCAWMEADAQASAGLLKMIGSGKIRLGVK